MKNKRADPTVHVFNELKTQTDTGSNVIVLLALPSKWSQGKTFYYYICVE